MAMTREIAIERMRAGETLTHVLPRGDLESESAFQYLSKGGRVTRSTYEHIKPNLVAVSSGLFEDAEPQVWRWKDAE